MARADTRPADRGIESHRLRYNCTVPEFSIPASDVAHAIQLAIAPVFLLTGIGALLSAMSFRLGRIVDRARLLEERPAVTGDVQAALHKELQALSQRAHLINRSITLCTFCALLICALIVVLFVGAFLKLAIVTAIALLFIAAMLALIASLIVFLQEIRIATATLQIGIRKADPMPHKP